MTPMCLPEIEDKVLGLYPPEDGSRVRETNASKWTASTTTSSIFSFQTPPKAKQNQTLTHLSQ